MEIKKTRLAKKIAASGVASRREAEKLIEAGRVLVNGESVKTPVFFVTDQDKILIDGKNISSISEEIIIWKFYKPPGVITTKHDPQNRKTVFDFFPNIDGRLLYVGRLDYNSEGLLLFTNNGNLARKLELPSTGLKRTYLARFRGNFPETGIRDLKNGIVLNGTRYRPIDIKLQMARTSVVNSWATVTLFEGKNREIRKVMEHFGCQVSRLVRVGYGPFKLGNLSPGKFSRVSDAEVLKLQRVIFGDGCFLKN
ncbi:MAG: rRNA pseudouridine synthase [Holosporaceae bacterium]|nr:rRNA pseudouridine synthase [Holosporaceae bacterium]